MAFTDGDIVWTNFGAGVIVGHRSPDEENRSTIYTVRLWRIAGKSMGSASLAYLNESAVVDKLCVAPGMTTTLTSESSDDSENKDSVMVHLYDRPTNSFLVSKIENQSTEETKENQEPFRVHAKELENSPSAKFYPILEALMHRGDKTAQEAIGKATELFQDEATQKFVQKAQDTLKSKFADTKEAVEGADVGSQMESLHKTVEETATKYTPTESQVKEVLAVVKDQELTSLLESCRERLGQLVQTEIPNATKDALKKTGIEILSTDGESSDDDQNFDVKGTLSASVETSREAALTALNDLMKELEINPSELDNVRMDVATKFTDAFDNLREAAKSDRGLNDLFESVADKTTVWQQETGRLLETRTASLFMEGANRLKTRAAAILQMQWIGGGAVGSKLTKAFTEKDAALAKLKSIELGESVKNRLVEAIEVRSESMGGLDGIIAGALSRVQDSGKQSGDKMKEMLSNLQSTASGTTANAHETLISVLSHQSVYRDVALLRIERVLCELDDQFGEDLTPEDIAQIARGEGGTAKLFEPIAKRAVKEIEKTLDAAETQVEDETVREVLKRVRKITSGELTVSALTEELIGMLNDEKLVSASENIFIQGEQVLDLLEGVSSNKAVNDALKIVEKAGITKDSVMKEFEKLNVDELLDTAGGAVTDEKKRQQLVSTATDTALEYILKILPSMPVPPLDGVRDGLVYNISNLSMKGFKVKKEDIQIQLAGMKATKNDAEEMEYEEISGSVKATELLIIDVKRISAVLDDAAWSFEQTYLPYLKGEGLADVKCSDGSIRLQFELRRKIKAQTGDKIEWEPVLCLHDRSCNIGEMDLSLQGEGKLTWIFNKLASIFKGPLRDYVVATILNILSNRSGWILERLNGLLSSYWGLILQTANLQMEDLAEASADDIIEASSDDKVMKIELVWKERLPLGMNLLMNDESGQLKVVDFPRGSQARTVAEKRGLDPDFFKGATIEAVNGSESVQIDELFEQLKDPARPKTVRFRLAEGEESERVRRFVEGIQNLGSKDEEEDDAEEDDEDRKFGERVVQFTNPGELGIVFEPSLDNCGLVVKGFLESSDGTLLAAERSMDIQLRDLLTHVNGELVVGKTGKGREKSLQMLEEAADKRPLSLSFVNSYLFRATIDRPEDLPGMTTPGGPSEMVLKERKLSDGSRRIFIKHFNPVSGSVETNGIFIGDYLVFVNGTPVGAGARWMGEGQSPSLDEVYEMLCNNAFYPIGLTFARPHSKSGSRWTSKGEDEPISDFEADTICVTCENQQSLGFILDTTAHGDIVVTDFNSVPGVFHSALSKYQEVDGKFHVAIDSINGQFVPSYATKEMVMSALTRSWNADRKVDIILCDDGRKKYVQELK